jgi:hypothetical protein
MPHTLGVWHFSSSYLCFCQPCQEYAMDGTHYQPGKKQNNSHEDDYPKHSYQLLGNIYCPKNYWHANQPGEHIGRDPDGSTLYFMAHGQTLSKG